MSGSHSSKTSFIYGGRKHSLRVVFVVIHEMMVSVVICEAVATLLTKVTSVKFGIRMQVSFYYTVLKVVLSCNVINMRVRFENKKIMSEAKSYNLCQVVQCHTKSRHQKVKINIAFGTVDSTDKIWVDLWDSKLHYQDQVLQK
jgi:hypothetical protein